MARVVACTGPGRVEVREVPAPAAEPGGTVVRVTLAGVCGTEAHILNGDVTTPYDFAMGHEGVGVVAELGRGVTTDFAGVPVRPGDRVYWSPNRPCHRCHACVVDDDPGDCDNQLRPRPLDVPGAATFGEYAFLGAGTAFFRIPDGTPSEAVIAFGCAMPTVLQGLDRLGGISLRDVVVVLGAGPVGISAAFAAHLCGARQVVVVGDPPHRLEAAVRFGADTVIPLSGTDQDERAATVRRLSADRGASVVVEAAGQVSAFGQGLELLGRNGALLEVGLWAGNGTTEVNPFRINNLNLRIVGTQFAGPEHYHRTVQLARRHHAGYPMAESVTHRFGLDRVAEAIGAAASGAALKAVLEPHRPAGGSPGP